MKGRVIGFLVFALVCLSLTVYVGAQIARVQTGSTYHLSAIFADVNGLESGDPVTVAGIPVGQVTSVHVVAGQAAVGMAIRSSIHVPSDTSVAVRWRNLIGQRYLSLVPGTSHRLLTPGSRITSTTSVVDLSALVNELGPLIGQVSPAQLNEILVALDQALGGNEVNADTLIADLNTLLSTLAQRSGTITQLLSDYSTISGAVASRDAQIATMVDNLAILSQAFADNTALVQTSLTQFSGLSSGLDQLLTTSTPGLHTVVDNLGTLADILRARIGALADALHGLPVALRDLFATTAKGHFLDVDLVCLSTSPTCQYPITLAGGPAALDSPSAFRQLLFGSS